MYLTVKELPNVDRLVDSISHVQVSQLVKCLRKRNYLQVYSKR